MSKRPRSMKDYQELGPGACPGAADIPNYFDRLAANGDMFLTKPVRTLGGWIAYDKVHCTWEVVRRLAQQARAA